MNLLMYKYQPLKLQHYTALINLSIINLLYYKDNVVVSSFKATLLFIVASKVVISDFKYELLLSASLFKELAKATSKSFIACFAYTFETESFKFKASNISIVLTLILKFYQHY